MIEFLPILGEFVKYHKCASLMTSNQVFSRISLLGLYGDKVSKARRSNPLGYYLCQGHAQNLFSVQDVES
jgi:hypothetical protein